MNKQLIFTKKSEEIATIYLNNPKKKNVITLEIWSQIPVILNELASDEEVKSVIIRGIDSTAFSAGGDIKEFATERATPERAMNYDGYFNRAGDALSAFSKPLIAMIEGPCIGGACELALACDLRFSSVTGLFGITPAKVGLVYGVSQTKRLIQTVGPARAKDILFSGRLIKAAEAYQMGLIDRVYEESKIVQETYEYAKLLGTRSQETIRAAKIISSYILEDSDDDKKIKELINKAYSSPDIKEGVAAFREKRTPKF